MTPENYEKAVEEIEKELNWTRDEAGDCGCNYRQEPCENCWSLGWRIGGLDAIEHTKP